MDTTESRIIYYYILFLFIDLLLQSRSSLRLVMSHLKGEIEEVLHLKGSFIVEDMVGTKDVFQLLYQPQR